MYYNIFNLFLVFAVSNFHVGVLVNGYETVVQLYLDAGPCKNSIGNTAITTPGHGSGYQCTYFTGSYYGELSSFELMRGSCARVYAGYGDCSGSTAMLTYKNFWSCAQPVGWNDRINAVGYCAVTSRTTQCNPGSFVRKVNVPEDDLMSGISMTCASPSSPPSDSPTTHINSVGSSVQAADRECNWPLAARGVNLKFNPSFQLYYGTSDDLVCGPGSSTSGTVCGPGQALQGFRSDVEESGVTKGITAICWDVPDITLSCTPTEFDSLVSIGICDNTGGASSKTCTFSQKLGWGDPDGEQFTDEDRNQKAFYSNYISKDSVPKNLLNRFKSIGKSKIVGVKFNWAEHGTRSWSPLQTKTITVTIPAATFTTFQQLKGKCSFYGVHTSYVKRIDLTTGLKPAETIFMSGVM